MGSFSPFLDLPAVTGPPFLKTRNCSVRLVTVCIMLSFLHFQNGLLTWHRTNAKCIVDSIYLWARLEEGPHICWRIFVFFSLWLIFIFRMAQVEVHIHFSYSFYLSRQAKGRVNKGYIQRRWKTWIKLKALCNKDYKSVNPWPNVDTLCLWQIQIYVER